MEESQLTEKVGVPFGGINESAIVGILEIQYRVNFKMSPNSRLV
jgi:hypothetical protein